jgi:RHS repeat-associated protein
MMHSPTEYGGAQTQEGGKSYITQDHLGSTRVVTGQGQEVKARFDYMPFGEEVTAGRTGYGSNNIKQKFTQKERDDETGLDFFGARYYASVTGRFTTVDPMGIDEKRLLDPQMINAYAYARNSPLRYIDPDGADPKEPRVVVVVFQGGHWSTDAVSGSSAGGSGGATTMVRVKEGARPDGLGESKIDSEAPNIAQQIKNDFPNADVIFAGPDAKDKVLEDLTNNKPDNIILYGYSRGGIMAVDLANKLNSNGQTVDLLITVDPLTRPSFSDPKIDNTSMVKEAINYTEHGAGALPVIGAKNYGVGTATREDPNKFPPTPIEHGTLDDITSPYVIKKIEDRLRELNR